MGLGFLQAACCVLDLGKNTLAFPGEPTVEMVHPTQAPRPLLPTSRAAEAHHGADPPLQAFPPTPLSPTPHTLVDVQPPALDQQSPTCGVDRLAAVREVWERNCDNLEPWQQEELWRLLLKFKDIFALTEEEVGLTHLVQHDIDTGDALPIKTRPRRLPGPFRPVRRYNTVYTYTYIHAVYIQYIYSCLYVCACIYICY